MLDHAAQIARIADAMRKHGVATYEADGVKLSLGAPPQNGGEELTAEQAERARRKEFEREQYGATGAVPVNLRSVVQSEAGQ